MGADGQPEALMLPDNLGAAGEEGTQTLSAFAEAEGWARSESVQWLRPGEDPSFGDWVSDAAHSATFGWLGEDEPEGFELVGRSHRAAARRENGSDYQRHRVGEDALGKKWAVRSASVIAFGRGITGSTLPPRLRSNG